VQAYHGILMSRDINKAYMVPLTDTFPANRKGVKGDVAKVSCATCHQGVAKPLNGAPLLKDHDVLAGAPAAATAAVVVPAAATTPVALSTGKLGSVFFATGKEVIDPAGMKTVVDAATAWKGAGGKGSLTISGFADQQGNVAANMDLAKKRAFAVRDALERAGVAKDRIELKKPETAVGGDGSESRRVDILSGS
jgi:photosynthetic reaction center cytochrome c subunit